MIVKMDRNDVARLYEQHKISAVGVLNAIRNKWISVQEAVDILGSDNALSVIRSAKLQEISEECGSTITGGIDVEIGDRTDHFNLALEDQSNINNLFRVVELGGTEYPYQADDGTCTVYSKQEIVQIYVSAQRHITVHTAYHNALKAYVLSLETDEEIEAVQYGMELPAMYARALNDKLQVAEEQMQMIVAKLSEAA